MGLFQMSSMSHPDAAKYITLLDQIEARYNNGERVGRRFFPLLLFCHQIISPKWR